MDVKPHNRRIKVRSIGLGFAMLLMTVPLTSGADAATFKSGNPPSVLDAKIDEMRRLVVTFSAPDGMTYGGRVYLDANPKNAEPVSVDPDFGPIMFCNNNYTCAGRWDLKVESGNGPFTFISSPLNETSFPSGSYFLQVETRNEDPYATTRMWEFSQIVKLEIAEPRLPALEIIESIKLPLDNGTSACNAWRKHLQLGNYLVAELNRFNAKLNLAYSKIAASTTVNEVIKRAADDTASIKKLIEIDKSRATAACSKTPPVVKDGGIFSPIPIPEDNSTQECRVNRSHLAYLNQEFMKVVNNLKVTKRSQITRVKQLEGRFNQLMADLRKSWPLVLKSCGSL